VESWLRDPFSNYGFLIWQTDIWSNEFQDQAITFASIENENPDLWPQLVLELET